MPSFSNDVSPDIADLADALDGSRPALVLGGMDTGKTTLVRHLARCWTCQGARVALLCADPGQPLIGLPGTLSLTLLAGEGEAIQPDRVAFVGHTSSHHGEDELLIALARLLREAVRLAPDRVLIDTCGTIHGPGVPLKQREVDLCAPVEVLALQRGEELEPILLPFRHRADVSIRRLTPSPQVQRKTPAQRRQNRRGRFADTFARARRRTFRWTSVPIQNLSVGLGTPFAPDYLKSLSGKLGASLVAAERCGDCGTVFTRGTVGQETLLRLKEYFGVGALLHAACEDLEGRLCGLMGKEGWTAGLGILCEVAPERQEVTCWTPLPEETEVAAIRVGSLALDPSGDELGVRGRSPVRYV